MILDIETNTLTTLDIKEETYFTATLDELKQMEENIKIETERILEESLKDLPEDQRTEYRKMIEERMKARDSETREPLLKDYKATGKSETIIGYTVAHYRAYIGDETLHEIWCTDGIDVAELRDFYSTISKEHLFREMRGDMSKLELGFPLKSRETADNKVTTSEVTAISFDPVPPTIFAVPDGYIQSSPLLEGKQ